MASLTRTPLGTIQKGVDRWYYWNRLITIIIKVMVDKRMKRTCFKPLKLLEAIPLRTQVGEARLQMVTDMETVTAYCFIQEPIPCFQKSPMI